MNIVDKVDAVIACLIAKSATEKAAALAHLEAIASIECDPISIDDAVCIALREIGIPSHQGGYQYLQYAIKKSMHCSFL